ncbi:MAG TPA: VCBS repeat-containing protein [Pseudomonadota bacterium]|nr:VCBS repeat-containing protein [Pseudomonadota bacterium]
MLSGCSERFGDDSGMQPPGSMSGPTACARNRDCPSGRRCIGMLCQPDRGDCATDNDCSNDTYCACPPELASESCACVPWGGAPRPGPYDPGCAGSPFEPGEFKNPILKCQWPPVGSTLTYKETIISPLVVDLDGDGKPEIVFAAGSLLGPAWVSGHLIALSGADCSVIWDRPSNIVPCMHLAAADLDGDGKMEIIGHAPGLTVFDYQGNQLATTPEPGGGNLCVRDYPPAIANLDGAGPPELIAGPAVFRFVRSPTPMLVKLWSHLLIEEGAWATIAIAEDLDGDGRMEVISGHNVWDGISGTDKTPTVMKDLTGGYTAIGDFNADGKPDIVLVSSRTGDQKVAIIDYVHDRFIMAPTAAVDGWGGPPTVADFDGDGRPEFATAGSHYYYVYSPDCLQSPVPAKCKGMDAGVLWQAGIQDTSSGSTGSSVFDFNGDGAAEVVYRDECWLRVFSGREGKKLFAAPVTSGTIVEEPIIADTDGDGHSEIVVTSDNVQGGACRIGSFPRELGIDHPGPTYGVRVFVDPLNRWLPSRPMWNQHSYHITNINDDGTVPLSEKPNYKSYNNYRQNVQGSASSQPPRPDATTRIELPPDLGDCVKLFRLGGVVCNRGSAELPASYPATFYLGDPRQPGARLICTGRTRSILQKGACQQVACDWDNPPPPPYDLWLRPGDDGKGGGGAEQCKGGNDLAHLHLEVCMSGPA